ncbi:MAG: glycerophosphodiester phosphodiesterase family protein [Gammaproteobacteria bacterium]
MPDSRRDETMTVAQQGNGREPRVNKRRTVPIVIAHRGASGYLPEHTLAAYAIAILQGADFVEPDLVMTLDGHLIARHDNLLNFTTDVASRLEFAGRRDTKVLDGVEVTGWFSEDFTLEEIKALGAIERLPQQRPANVRFDNQFGVPTLEEIIALVQGFEASSGRPIGLYPETKHPTYFQKRGLAMEQALVATLRRGGYEAEKRRRIFIQSFETANLKALREMTAMPLVQLLGPLGQPYDVASDAGTLSYDAMASREGLQAIAAYADGVGVEKGHFVLPAGTNTRDQIDQTSRFVEEAHRTGLVVHAYTFRAETALQPESLWCAQPEDPRARDRLMTEIKAFLATGLDGFFVDQPDVGVKARDAFLAANDRHLPPVS